MAQAVISSLTIQRELIKYKTFASHTFISYPYRLQHCYKAIIHPITAYRLEHEFKSYILNMHIFINELAV